MLWRLYSLVGVDMQYHEQCKGKTWTTSLEIIQCFPHDKMSLFIPGSTCEPVGLHHITGDNTLLSPWHAEFIITAGRQISEKHARCDIYQHLTSPNVLCMYVLTGEPLRSEAVVERPWNSASHSCPWWITWKADGLIYNSEIGQSARRTLETVDTPLCVTRKCEELGKVALLSFSQSPVFFVRCVSTLIYRFWLCCLWFNLPSMMEPIDSQTTGRYHPSIL